LALARAAAPSTKGKTVFGKSAFLGTKENHRFLVMDQSRYAKLNKRMQKVRPHAFNAGRMITNRTGRPDKKIIDYALSTAQKNLVKGYL